MYKTKEKPSVIGFSFVRKVAPSKSFASTCTASAHSGMKDVIPSGSSAHAIPTGVDVFDYTLYLRMALTHFYK
ncbi:hypothetical protein GCM10007096_17270 [Pullulanibacillus pueri]|uniref:Uncharacterized protein n=1 Tax=Pullulanibacillus pueri TaxID=1437324 RepID=A0A8J2ZW67_9BACL|nr:hypothetical protein GCM10007096_17270 [Pullulanibacillus pueri]